VDRNDLIIFEFSNPMSGEEVLLDPAIVVEIKATLTGCIAAWAKADGEKDFSLMLAGVQRGSVKLGYLLRFMGHANTVIDVAAKASAGVFWAGVALGVFVPQGVSAPAQPVSPEFVQACSQYLNQLMWTATRSGAEEVSISVAGCGTATISSKASKDIALIGSTAPTPAVKVQGTYRGPLRALNGPYRFERVEDGHQFDVYTGEVKPTGGAWYPVVVLWQSIRPVESAIAAGEVTVDGELSEITAITMQRLSAEAPIDPMLRRAGGYLYVRSQTVSE
jgi:hypothetical protein